MRSIKRRAVDFPRGFIRSVLEIELELQSLPFKAQCELTLNYKGRQLRQKFIPDLILFDKIVVELKAVRELTDDHRAQVFNYLRATNLRLGLLINFGHFPGLQYERIVL